MKWYNMHDHPLQICGLAVKEKGRYHRLPDDVIDQVNENVAIMATYPVGGRVRFRTDSPCVMIRYSVGNTKFGHDGFGYIGTSGVDCYVDGSFRGGRSWGVDSYADVTFRGDQAWGYAAQTIEVLIQKQRSMQDVEIYLPALNTLLDLEAGVDNEAAVEAPSPFAFRHPFVYYGSSITQGAFATRPGLNYVALTARKMGADFCNLGFASGARGERIMAEYIAGLPMSLFVMDYDHNAPSVEHLKNTHFHFYQTVREKNPELPILMLSKPDFDGNLMDDCHEKNAARRAVIMETYSRAKNQGDKNIWFIDGQTLYGDCDRCECTTDNIHPNDLGFYRMAEKVLPVMREIFGLL